MSHDVLARAERTIAQGSRSFAAAARLLDRATRDDAVMLYAWCRHCDDVIDGQCLGHGQRADSPTLQRVRLARLRQDTADVLAGRPAPHPAFEALRRVLARHPIAERHPQELLTGFAMDVEGRVYRDLSDTLDYCYHVAGVVGVMMAIIMGVRDARVLDRASDLGIAFQLTNIARDAIEDANVGRIYVPRDLLERYGIASSLDPADPAHRAALRQATLRLLDTAEDYYASALAGLSALPRRSAWAIAAARRIYRGIGVQVRANADRGLEARAATGRARKLVLLCAALIDAGRSRVRTQELPRAGLWQRP